ncbi:sialidase family protein [Albibacterium profundi]|uniref:exo-alpha-sialidase n=1 Tax=Albibacterium profundi TaxID=3134906 RepID=A0ABV5CF81_9SPHI
MKKIIPLLYQFLFTMLLLQTGCYKEQHFDFPGPFDEDIKLPDTLPFPFDESRQAGIWLMKDGIPEHDKVLFKGYTDYKAMHDTVSWILEPNGVRLRPHRNFYPLSNADHLGGDPNSYQRNWVVSKYFVPVGTGKSFYMYFKATVGTFSGTAAGLVLGRSWENGREFIFGFDGYSAIAPMFFVDLYERTFSVSPDNGWPTVNEVITPGVPAEFEVVIHENLFYVKVNGVLCFQFKLPHQGMYFFTPTIRPWRNFLTMYDFYIEAPEAYTVDYAFYHTEFDYNRFQHPSLALADNDEVLLFAEGRKDYTTAQERIDQTVKPVGNTDIVLRRSTDGGNTWNDQVQVIAGEGSNETFAYPQVVKAADGTLILHYSKVVSAAGVNGSSYNTSEQRVYQVSSTDNGTTWSSPQDITNVLKPADGGMQHASGHGIVLEQEVNKGRLLMPVNYGTNQVRVAYSDDKGNSWQLGGAISGTNNLRYGSVVELEDGRLMMLLSHTNVNPRSKVVSYSEDGGVTWSSTTGYSEGITTFDYGHMFPSVLTKDANGKLMYVAPTGRETDAQAFNSPAYAHTPVLFTSQDNGASFSSAGNLFTKQTYNTYVTPTGLMDAVVLSNGKLLIATEGGVETPFEGIVVYQK